MIALDASALLAIVLAEPEAMRFARLIVSHDSVVAAPTILEAHLKVGAPAFGPVRQALEFLLGSATVQVIAFDAAHLAIAKAALAQYGRGRGHAARLNFGDCMAYAVAKKLDIPLLFKGDDFIHTDIKSALRT